LCRFKVHGLRTRIVSWATHTYSIWLIAIDLLSRVVSDMPRAPRAMIIAVGLNTQHWYALSTEFPIIHNCCLDVRDAFSREWDEDTQGTGFELSVRNRIKAKMTWGIVFQTAWVIAQEMGLVIIVCNHGKHRSLSLAVELATYLDGHLVSIRHEDRPLHLRHVTDFMNEVRPRLNSHTHAYSHRTHPVVGISVCKVAWDGHDWEHQLRTDSMVWQVGDPYLTIHINDIVIIVSTPPRIAQGWQCGVLVRQNMASVIGWFPPTAVEPIVFPTCPDLVWNLMKVSRRMLRDL